MDPKAFGAPRVMNLGTGTSVFSLHLHAITEADACVMAEVRFDGAVIRYTVRHRHTRPISTWSSETRPVALTKISWVLLSHTSQ
jgi:hypothetical protein